MTSPNANFRLTALSSLMASAMLLAACGGGTGSGASATADTAAATNVPAADTASAATTPDTATAQATAATTDGTKKAQAIVVVTDTTNTSSSTSTVSTTLGKTYYVSSTVGSDSYDGSSATVGTGGVGPFKTLAKVAALAVKPGDTVNLVCGGVWHETLKLAASGIAGSPITVAAYPRNCSNKPVIDGSQSVPSTSWTQYSGNIYRAPFSFQPWQLYTANGQFTEAHHPNQGFDTTQPTSVFLRNAINSNSVAVNGTLVSTYITAGADLKLPSSITSIPAGTRVRIRPNAWAIDETSVASVSGNTMTLSAPTSYPVNAGWGYYFVGSLWMLDSPGEWYYDATNKYLYAWMPDSTAPGANVTAGWMATGVDLSYKQYVQLDGLSVRLVTTGMNLRNTTGVAVRNSKVEDAIAMGIDAASSVSDVIESNTINRAGKDAISGTDNTSTPATGLRVAYNRVTNSGVIMNGDTPVGLPRVSFAAIRSGKASTVVGNTVIDVGNIGIFPMAGSTVNGNYVSGACSVLDDCGGIYTSGQANNSVISNNIVYHSRGSTNGKPANIAYTQAQGIYLDEFASGVQVTGNTVADADNGIQVHIAANNVFKYNKLYGNRNNQIWLQETSNKINAAGDIFGNTVYGNHIVPTTSTAGGVLQTTTVSNTYAFAAYDQNRYFDKIYPTISAERAPSYNNSYYLPTWKSALTTTGTARNLDPNGAGTSQLKYASYKSTGSNVVPNPKLATALTGWVSWNQTAPYGTMTRVACTPGYCAHYVAGASAGIVSSPNFSVTGGQWYRLSFDYQAGANNQFQQVVVRNGGGGTAGFEQISNVNTTLTGSTAWARYSFVFQATKTVLVNDPTTGGKGARIDFQGIQPGTSINVTNMELVPISAVTSTTRTDILINGSSSAQQMACPVAATTPALCSNYVKFSDSTPVTFPYYVPAMSSEIIFTLDASLADADGDGVPDSQDLCPNTAAGAAVNASGCPFGT